MNTILYIYIISSSILLFLFCIIVISVEINISKAKAKPKLLRYGSKGLEVMKIQRMLNFINTTECKFDHHIREDGLFYEETLREVKFFQLTHDLNPDGFVGNKTKIKIMSLYNVYKNDISYRDYYRGLNGNEYENNLVKSHNNLEK